MTWFKRLLPAITAITASAISFSTMACTNITLKAKDGTVLVGRTLEFGPPLNSNINTSNRGTKFSNTAPNGKPSMSWSSKYGYVYLSYFGQPHPVDGMNEKGLSIGLLFFPGFAQYQALPDDPSKAMPYFQFAEWVLGNFDNVNDLKTAIPTITVFSQKANIPGQGDVAFPVHYVITDASGNSITVEWTKSGLQIYDNKLGILTNDPSFDWHMTSLQNYSNLSPYAPAPQMVDGISYSGLGQGSGAIGLPGDASPPSRFIKMAFLTNVVVPADDATGALVLAQHMINNVDLPKGFVRGPKDSNAPMDTTQWTVFKDLKNMKLYFKSYDYPSLRVIDLNKVDFSNKSPTLSMPVTKPAIQAEDVTANYLQSKIGS